MVDTHMHVYAVDNRPRKALFITDDFTGGAFAGFGTAVVTAGAGVSGSYQNKISRKRHAFVGAHDGYYFIFQRLSQGFYDVTPEFGELVQ